MCANPECDNPNIAAKGYCSGCYSRLRRKGTLTRTNVINTGVCSVCGDEAFAKNLCSRHYAQNRHPLRWVWANIRSRNKGQWPSYWDKFEPFLADVGERPTPRHQLRRYDPSQPFSRENTFWKAPVMAEPGNSQSKEYARRWHLRQLCGLELEEYNRLFSAQRGRCVICNNIETAKDRNGNVRPLATDHCHKGGGFRGLICNRCNHMLGLAEDRIELLYAAIDYIEKDRAAAMYYEKPKESN